MKRETGAGQCLIRCHRASSRRRRSENIRNPVVGPRMEVACGARRLAVAARLGIPEQRLAQCHERYWILDIDGHIGWLGNRNLFQRGDLGASPRTSATLSPGERSQREKEPCAAAT